MLKAWELKKHIHSKFITPDTRVADMANLTPTRTLAALAILAGHAWAMPKILVLHGRLL